MIVPRWSHPSLNGNVTLSDGTPFRIGLHVQLVYDERHVGRIERMSAAGSIVVKWKWWNGYHQASELKAAPAELVGFD